VLRDRRFQALLAAAVTSSTGSNMTTVALLWFVLATTGSATKMGVVFAVRLAPLALFGFASGRVVDRIGAGTTIIAADAARAVLIATIPLLYHLEFLSFGVLLGLVFSLGILGVPYYASQRLVLSDIVENDEQAVAQGNSLLEGTTEVTTLVGPALAGVLIVFLGPANVLWIDAASYAISAALLASAVPRRRAHLGAEVSEPRGVLAGVRFLRGDPLLGPICVSSLIFGFAGPALIAAIPFIAFARYDENPKIAGWLLAAFGAGAVVGSLATYRLLERMTALQVARVGVVGLVIFFWLVAVPMPAWTLALVLASMGLWNPFTNTVIALFTTRVPPTLRASVMTSLITINGLTAPAGYAIGGLLLERAGLPPTIVVMAAIDTIAAIVFVSASLRYD
jgi:predicted MFS family arabinose efflux permease